MEIILSICRPHCFPNPICHFFSSCTFCHCEPNQQKHCHSTSHDWIIATFTVKAMSAPKAKKRREVWGESINDLGGRSEPSKRDEWESCGLVDRWAGKVSATDRQDRGVEGGLLYLLPS